MTPTPTIPSWAELSPIMPEIWLSLTMCAVVLLPFIRRDSVALPFTATLVGLGLALAAAIPGAAGSEGQFVFSGMLTIDPFSQFFKVLLLSFTAAVMVLWLVASRKQTHTLDVPDYLLLLLGATLGMALMASASNLLMIFIAMETASFPSFALAGFRKRNRLATEGSLKYVLFGAAASAVGVYGMSLIYATTGTLDLALLAEGAAAAGGFSPMFAVGLLAMFAGIAFKLSAVPLHFWCPDVFQGAPIDVTTFLSVASKGAAMCLLIRILMAFGVAGANAETPVSFTALATGVAILGAVTATWGNLLALHQTNIKRLLAFSSIAHAGYMIMAAGLVAVAPDVESARTVAGAVLLYIFIYLFMNLGAFTVAAVISQRAGTEDIRQYTGMARRSPLLMVLLTLFLLSLFGMPGLGGFWGKILLARAMYDAVSGVAFALIIVLFLNTIISLYYYMRPVYFMVFAREAEPRPAFVPHGIGVALTLVCAAALLWTGILPNFAANWTRDAATLLVSTDPADNFVSTAPARLDATARTDGN